MDISKITTTKPKKNKATKKANLVIEEDNELKNDVTHSETRLIDDFINKIINEDSEKVLKEIPSDSIDLTVTSPPYDDIRDYKGYNFDLKISLLNIFFDQQ